MHYNISVDGYQGFRYLNNMETARSKAIERLSSGYRINHTSDDAAGASMSSVLRTQIRGLMQASRNSEDMINLLNTAETGIATMTQMLQRIRELSVRAASDTNTTEDRMYMQEEVNQLLKEIERVSKDTEFNGMTLFNNDPNVGGAVKAGGLTAVLGEGNITPNGKLTDKYTDADGNEYAAAVIDLEKFNKPGGFTKKDLYNTGFNSTCYVCNKPVNIKFVKGTESYLTRDSKYLTFNIGIDELSNSSTGKELAERVVKEMKQYQEDAESGFPSHYTLYASSGSKLYVYDEQVPPSNWYVFETEVFGEPVKEISRQPVIHAQVGSNTNDRVAIEFPYISLETLGIEDVDITTREGATDALGKMDKTMVFLTKERAKISLWASRISHSASNADIGAYNHTLSESKIMDTNYADEVLELSKAQVLTEFGISSVTEVHKMIENVLKFIG